MPYLSEKGGRIEAGALIKANERGYQILNRTLNRDIDQAFLDDLFSEENFQDVSGKASIRAEYAGTSWSFTPLHVVGAFKLANPSLPEIHLSGASQSITRISQNIHIKRWPGDAIAEIVISPSLIYYNRRYAFLDTDILSAAGQKLDGVVEKFQESKFDADLTVDWLSKQPGVPSLGIRTYNLASQKPCAICTDRLIDIEPAFRTRAEATLGIDIPHPIGHSYVAGTLPFRGAFRQFDPLEAGGSYAYKLSRLGCFAAYSAMIYRFGFLFDADGYRLGVAYTDEKQDNSLQIERRKQTYVFTSAYL